MSAENPETPTDFSHWPWHGWVDNSTSAVSPQLTKKERHASQLERRHRMEDLDWETLILRLF